MNPKSTSSPSVLKAGGPTKTFANKNLNATLIKASAPQAGTSQSKYFNKIVAAYVL